MPRFMKKINMAYAKYFNIKYERSGALFQGRYKSRHIDEDNYLRHMPHYIHLNPLDMLDPEWRSGKIKNPGKALEYLKGYRWSSFPDYIGINNFPSVIHKNFLSEIMGKPQNYKNNIMEEIKEMGDLPSEFRLE